MLIISRFWMVMATLCSLMWMDGCKQRGDEVSTAADEIELSANPATFLAGAYQLERLDLPSGYGEQVPGLTSQYEVVVDAVGDSVQLSLSGKGEAGQFNALSLGTFTVTPSSFNLNSLSVGSQYRYDLLRSSGQKSAISFTRTPFTDKTEYGVLFNLYRIGYGFDPNKGRIVADESFSINPTYNERIATLRLVRTSTGVWRKK